MPSYPPAAQLDLPDEPISIEAPSRDASSSEGRDASRAESSIAAAATVETKREAPTPRAAHDDVVVDGQGEGEGELELEHEFENENESESESEGAGVPSHQDMAELMDAFNTVTVRLQRTHGALQSEVRRLKRELRETNEKLRRSRELAALGQMAAGIAHEIRNPLGSIRLYASMLAEDLADREDCERMARRIEQATTDLDAIVGDVLAFSREIEPRAVSVHPCDLVNQALESTVSLLHQSSIEIRRQDLESKDACPNVFADPGVINQALGNLVRNAIEAMEGAGVLEISLDWADQPAERGEEGVNVNGDRDVGADDAASTAQDSSASFSLNTNTNTKTNSRANVNVNANFQLNSDSNFTSGCESEGKDGGGDGDGDGDADAGPRLDGPYVAITIADSGPGFDEDALAHLFTPFFTTRSSGTGLGLAITHRIIDVHRGAIDAFNGEGGGACVRVMLPADANSSSARESTGAATRRVG